MRHLARKDLFYIEFTKNFIPDKIEEFYKPYVKNMPTQLESPRTLVESTLQGVTIPSYQYEGVEQGFVDTLNKNEIKTNWRSTLNAQGLTEKNLTLTFKLINGYVNYWILLDTFFFHYDMKNPNAFIGDISLRMLDNQDNVMFSRVYRDCILTGISDFELSYSENIQTFETFSITLQYSKVESTFANPGNPNAFTTNPSKFIGKLSEMETKSEESSSSESESESEPEPSPLLLDSTTGASVAYSLRKLKNSYTGNAIQVRRDSDNTTQDIGFVNNELDTATLNTFCSGTDGYVTIWYDQSGNDNNLTQPTANNQFKIVNSGSIYTINSKPAFLGVEDYMENTTKTASSTATMFVVHKGDNNTSNVSLAGFPVNHLTAPSQIGLYYWGTSPYNFGFNTWVGDSFGYTNATSDFDSQSLWVGLFKDGNITTSGVKIFRNGTEKTLSQTRSNSSGTRNIGDGFKVGVGGQAGGNQESNGYYQEIIVWDDDYSLVNRNTIETNINTYYSIY